MIEWLSNQSPLLNAGLAAALTWAITGLGALLVLFVKETNSKVMNPMMSIAAGIMLAASYYSLLLPSAEMAESLKMIPWLVCSIGFLLGGVMIYLGAKLFSKISKSKFKHSKHRRNALMIFSITLHNIPEGLAIGVSFGSIGVLTGNTSLLIASWLLAIGIGIQNFPEGAAISFPLLASGYSKRKAALVGFLSAIVEPISAVLGVILVTKVKMALPFLLAFAAGAMIYVVTEELIPETQKSEKKGLMTLYTILGFTIMMLLDMALSR